MGKRIENIYDCLKVRVLLDQIADKWAILVIGTLSNGPVRFNQIKRTVEGVSQKTLTECLRKLERNGLVERTVVDAVYLGIQYSLTPLGESLSTPMDAVYSWVNEHNVTIERAQKKFDLKSAKKK